LFLASLLLKSVSLSLEEKEQALLQTAPLEVPKTTTIVILRYRFSITTVHSIDSMIASQIWDFLTTRPTLEIDSFHQGKLVQTLSSFSSKTRRTC